MADEVAYPDNEFIFDKAKLKYDLMNIHSGELELYLTDFFEEDISRFYQRDLMYHHPFYASVILKDYAYNCNSEKQDVFLSSLIYRDKNQGKIVLVDGAMGGGKTGFGCWVIDEYHERFPNLKFYFVTKSPTHPKLPSWFKIVNSIDKVQNGSIALIDEGAIQLSSRGAMRKENKEASEMLVKLRQKGITMIILVQHVKMVDVNVRRLANIRVLKYGIDFGSDDLKDEDVLLIRRRLRPRNRQDCYIEIPSTRTFLKFSHGLPAWWDDEAVSKYMKGWKSEKKDNHGKKAIQDRVREI